MDVVDHNTEGGFDPESDTSWASGFIEIIVSPVAAGIKTFYRPFAPFFLALVLWAIAAFVQSTVPALNPNYVESIKQMQISALTKMKDKMPASMYKERVDEVRESPMPKPHTSVMMALGLGAIAILFVSALFWVGQRTINPEDVSFFGLMAVVSYGSSISVLGVIAASIGMYFSGSMVDYFSVSQFFSMMDNPVAYFVSSRLSLFVIWEYIALGFAVGRFSGLSSAQGLAIGVVVYFIMSALAMIPTLGPVLMFG